MKRGTSINILFNLGEKERIPFLTSMAMFINNNLNTVTSAVIYFNEELISVKDMTHIYKDDIGEVKYSDKEIISVLQTNDIPFSPLRQYVSSLDIFPDDVLSFIESNIVVNIYKGNYTPVQSRNKLIMDEERKKKLVRFLLRSFHYLITKLILNGTIKGNELDRFVDNFTSEQDIKQITPVDTINRTESMIKTDIEFRSNYLLSPELFGERKFYKYKSLKDFYSTFSPGIIHKNTKYYQNINSILKHFVDSGEIFTIVRDDRKLPRSMEIIPLFGKSYTMDEYSPIKEHEDILSRYEELIGDWFENKFEMIQKKDVFVTDKREKDETGTEDETGVEYKKDQVNIIREIEGDVSKLLDIFIFRFWKIGRKLAGDSLIIPTNFISTDAPVLLTGDVNVSKYNPDGNYIVIDSKLLNEEEKINIPDNITDFIALMYGKYGYLFKSGVVSSVLIHELAHAWSGTIHGSSHGDMKLVIDNVVKIDTYESSAMAVYSFIIRNGLWNDVYDHLRM